MADTERDESCQDCQRLQVELEAFVKTQEAGLPTPMKGHEENERSQVVTAVMLHVLCDRMLAELGNPFHVMSILTRHVMSRVQFQVVRPGAEPAAPAGEIMSDADLMSIPAEDLPSA